MQKARFRETGPCYMRPYPSKGGVLRNIIEKALLLLKIKLFYFAMRYRAHFHQHLMTENVILYSYICSEQRRIFMSRKKKHLTTKTDDELSQANEELRRENMELLRQRQALASENRTLTAIGLAALGFWWLS